MVRPQGSNKRVLSQEENWPQLSECWQSVWDGNHCFFPGHEAWVLGPPEEGYQVWEKPVWLRKGWGPSRKKPGLGRPGHCLPGWTIAHVQLKPVQETNLHFIFLVGPFFFFRLLTEKILKSRKLKKEKKKKILVHEIKIFFIAWSSLPCISLLAFPASGTHLKASQSHRLSELRDGRL